MPQSNSSRETQSFKQLEARPPPQEVLAHIRSITSFPGLPSLSGRNVSVAYFPSRSSTGFVRIRDVPAAGVVANFFSGHIEQKRKDKNAFLVGDCKEARASQNMQSLDAFVIDCDGLISRAALMARIEEKKITAIVYTTYSHGKISTTVRCAEYERFAKINNLPFPPTRESMTAYLRANRLGHLQNIDFNLTPETRQKYLLVAEKSLYVVHHDPLDKVRVVFFLKTTLPIVGPKGVGLDGVRATYDQAVKELLGPDALELVDLSFRNPAQLLYLPAKPAGTTVDHQMSFFDGELYDWERRWPEVAEELARRRARTEERRRQFENASYDAKLRQLAECLKHIPADEYNSWIRCLLIIFNETDGSDDGLRLAHEWSASNPEKYDEISVDRRWQSFGSSASSGSRVGLGTLVLLARQNCPEFRLPREASDFDLGLIGY